MLSTLLALGLAPLPCSPTGPVTSTAVAALTAAPAADAVDDLIAEGRRKLVARDPAGALESFEKAHAKSGGKERTELWILRGRPRRATSPPSNAWQRSRPAAPRARPSTT